MHKSDFLLLYRRRFRGAPRVVTEPVNFVAPVVSGDLDGILTCSTGSWSQMWSQTFTYQWKDADDDSDLTGETANTLDSQDHIGLEVYCTVTATNSADSTAANSNTVGPLEEASEDGNDLLWGAGNTLEWGAGNSLQWGT
jgi:hypothetical protein